MHQHTPSLCLQHVCWHHVGQIPSNGQTQHQKAGTHNPPLWEELQRDWAQGVDIKRGKPTPHNNWTICSSPSPTFVEFLLHARHYGIPHWIGSSLCPPGNYSPIKEISEAIKKWHLNVKQRAWEQGEEVTHFACESQGILCREGTS